MNNRGQTAITYWREITPTAVRMFGMQKGSGKSVRKLRFQILYTVRGMLIYLTQLERKKGLENGVYRLKYISWKVSGVATL